MGLHPDEDGLELYFEGRALAGVATGELALGSSVEFYLMRYRPGCTFVVENLSLSSSTVAMPEGHEKQNPLEPVHIPRGVGGRPIHLPVIRVTISHLPPTPLFPLESLQR